MIFIKKWNVILLCAILFVSVLSLGLYVRQSPAVETGSVPGAGKKIVLDAGHGAPDGGTEGKLGVLEKDLNLAVTKLLQGYLEQSGAQVILTRADDDGVYDAGSHSIRQKKRTDLKNREAMIADTDAEFFVSIHMNHFSDSKYSGPQVFYSKNHPDSKGFAESVQASMIRILKPLSERQVKQAGKEIYLLSKTNIPSILIECGFLSNEAEEKLLVDPAYQKKLAWAIYCGVVEYLAM